MRTPIFDVLVNTARKIDWHRVICMVLVFVMLFGYCPMPVNSVETDEFSQYLNYQATFADYYETFLFAADPSVITDYTNWTGAVHYSLYDDYVGSEEMSDDEYYALIDQFYSIKMDIVSYYVSAEDHGAFWLKVTAASGYTLPEELQDNPWIFAYYSGQDGEEENSMLYFTMPEVEHSSGVTVTGDIPVGATLDVTDYGDGLFDIKVYDENGNEWQPIDEGKTVQISIPVEGDIATVTHIIDYAPAIVDNANVQYISIADASAEELELFDDAIAASDRDGYVATEIFEDIEITDGIATFETGSFSVYKADGSYIQETSLWLDCNPNDIEEYYDNGTVYVDRNASQEAGNLWEDKYRILRIQTNWEGTVKILSSNANFKIGEDGSWEAGTQTYRSDRYDTLGAISYYDIDMRNYEVGEEIVVYVSSETGCAKVRIVFVETPAAGAVTFLGENGETWKTVESVFDDEGKEGDALPSPEWSIDGYAYAGWKVVEISDNVPGRGWVTGNVYTHYPAYRHGSVVLEAQWTPTPYTIRYDPNGDDLDGEVAMPNYDPSYTIEDLVELPIPTCEGYTFNGWIPREAVGNWGTELIPRGSNVQGKYGDVELVASWTANGDTQYTVRHIFEGLPGQENEIIDEILYGASGDPATATARQVAGFTASIGTIYNIAGDGSTIVEITYSRISYTVTWVPNNDIDESISVLYLYGMIILPQAAPADKTGHKFAGWDGFTENMTMPAANLTFTALWAKDVYNVKFNTDGGAELSAIPYSYNTTIYLDTLPTPIKEGYTFLGWVVPDGVTVEIVGGRQCFKMPAREITLTAQWTANTYTVIWENWDGTVLETDTGVAYGATPEYNGTTPTKDSTAQYSYTFSGWSPTVSAVTGDVTYTAQFVEDGIGYLQVVKVRYQNADGTWGSYTTVISQSYDYGETFPGWSRAADTTYKAASAASYTVTGEKTTEVSVYRQQYTVTWKNEDGTVLETDTGVAYGATPEYNGATPTKASTAQYSYTFSGWKSSLDNQIHTELPQVTAQVTYTAVYSFTENTYTVTWNANGGKFEDNLPVRYTTVKYGGKADAPAVPSREGYTFNGWDVVTSNVTNNMEVYAQWTINQYTVTWKNEDGTPLETDTNVAYGITPSYDGETPTKDATAQYSYTFSGWDADSDGDVDEISAVTGDAIYTAVYSFTENTYTVTWKNEDGTVLETDTGVAYGATPEYNGTTPTKDSTAQYSYTFSGWTPAISTVTGETTYTAVYSSTVNKYTITFDTDGGSEIEAITQDYGTNVTAPADPTKTGYTFAGWDKKIPATMPAENVTVTAQWTINQYTITFDTDGGSEIEAITQDYGTDVTAPADPTKTGYTFASWDKEIPATMPAENVTVTAQWTANTNTVYVVYHWQQNINGDSNIYDDENYTLKETEHLTGTSDASIKPAVRTYDGFTSPEAVEITIKPDGSLVVNYYYTRNQYTVTVQNDKGISKVTGAGTYYYGQQVKLDSSLEPGYEFESWTGDMTSESFTMPAKDITVTANAKAIQYTIAYDLDGGTLPESVNESTPYTVENSITLPIPTKQYYTFVGWKVVETDGNWKAVNEIYTPNEVQLGANKYGNVELKAVWEHIVSDLTIVVQNAAPDDHFIFEVNTASGTGNISGLKIVVKGSSSTKVTGVWVGATYSVTMTKWSWKYNDISTQNADFSKIYVNITENAADSGVTVTFTVSARTEGWLDGESYFELRKNG